MKLGKCGFARQKRLRVLVRAVVPLAATATPSLIYAQALTVVTFNGTGYAFNTQANYTGNPTGTPSSGDLVDVTGVAAFAANAGSTSTTISAAVQSASGSGSSTVNMGALVFDLGTAVPSGQSVAIDGSYTGNTPGTISLAGGVAQTTLASGATVNAGDLITVTSNVGGVVNLGQTGNGTLNLVLPAAGGNFDVAPNSTLELGYYSLASGSTGPIDITGGGTVTLFDKATNTITGGMIISAGTLSVFNAGGFGTAGSSTVTINGGVLSFGQSEALNSARSIILDQAQSVIDVPTNGTGSVSIPGSLTGTGGLVKTGGGSLTLGGTNTYAGSQTVAGGVLSVGGAVQFGATPTSLSPSVILSGGTLMITGNNSGISGNREIVLGNGVSGGTGTIDMTTTHTTVFDGPFIDSGGAGMLAKVDTGTLVLGSASGSTYTGGTIVNGGLLLTTNTSGSGTGSGPVTVGDGASNAGSFGGNGIVAGNITVKSNGTLTPGTYTSYSTAYSAGTLTGGGSLALNTGSTVVEKIASQSAYDSTNIAGNISLGSSIGLYLVNLGYQPIPTDKFVLFTITGTGALSGFVPTTPTTTGTFVINAGSSGYYVGNASIEEDTNFGGQTEIYLTGVPEPTSAAALLGTGSLLLRRRRRAQEVNGGQADAA